jgi:non-heme chloroperoxidase
MLQSRVDTSATIFLYRLIKLGGDGMWKIGTVLLALLLSVVCANAQGMSGQWQGALHRSNFDLRLVVKIAKTAKGALRATIYSIDQGPEVAETDTVTVTGSAVKFSIIRDNSLTYEGVLSADRNSMSGTFTRGEAPISLVLKRTTPDTAWPIDPSPHTVRFVTVGPGVKLEVLDWGGTGKPLVFLAGAGDTGHVFDKFALNFRASHHVYAITRRGFGQSSAPDPKHSDYSAHRLGADVLAVIAALKLDRPVLAGHSIAGEELSEAAEQAPQKLSGLVYLDAGYAYSLYAPGVIVPLGASLTMDYRVLQQDLPHVDGDPSQADIQSFQTHLGELQQDIAATQAFSANLAPASGAPQPKTPEDEIRDAILAGVERHTSILVPTLAFFALDPEIPASLRRAKQAEMKAQAAEQEHQADLFEASVPGSRVIRLQGAAHDIWRTNEADVTREMNSFMDALPH